MKFTNKLLFTSLALAAPVISVSCKNSETNEIDTQGVKRTKKEAETDFRKTYQDQIIKILKDKYYFMLEEKADTNPSNIYTLSASRLTGQNVLISTDNWGDDSELKILLETLKDGVIFPKYEYDFTDQSSGVGQQVFATLYSEFVLELESGKISKAKLIFTDVVSNRDGTELSSEKFMFNIPEITKTYWITD